MSENSTSEEVLSSDFLNQVSVFETFRVYEGRIFFCEKHLERLLESCLAIGKQLPLGADKIKLWLEQSLTECSLKNASMRLSVHWLTPEEGRFVLFLRHFESHPKEWYEKGVEVFSSVLRRPPLNAQNSQAKASQYVSGVLAMLDREEGRVSHELLFLGPLGTAAEGTVSNFFLIKQKRLLTPCSSSGILKGVTRGAVMELAQKRGLEVLETHLTRHDFYTADECFLTNTSSEVLPVTVFDGRKIGGGLPGPVTRLLGQDFTGLRERF